MPDSIHDLDSLVGTENISFVDREVFRDPRFDSKTKALYSILTTYCDENGIAEVPMSQLAADLGMSVRAVQMAVKCGADNGLFAVTRPGGFGAPNRYQLLDFVGAPFNPRRVYVERFPHQAIRLPEHAEPEVVVHPDKVRRYRLVGDRSGWTCSYCGVPLADPTRPRWWATGRVYPELDHVIARSRGGSNSVDNLALACRVCNGKKGDRLLSELPPGWWRCTSRQAGTRSGST